jgi:hypothetical protein
MTDTRTDPRTDARPNPTADEPATPTPAAPEDGSTERLSTSDIAAGGDGRTTARTGESARTDETAEPAPTAATARSVPDSKVPDAKTEPLFSDDAAAELRERWTDVQAGFVDEPRDSVERADALVAEVMKRLADSFATERQALERQWSSGEQASTEDLRVALRRYRSFFDRLLSI